MRGFDITGKVAVVTGGNGGIGLGMARALAAAGASVVVAARDMAKSAAAVKELEALGAHALAVEVDVSREPSVGGMVQAAVEHFRRLDILVNNAGINVRKSPEAYTLDEWRQILDTNLTSAFLCSKVVYPFMLKAGGGKIINVGSMLSLFGASFAAAYGASKGGIVQLTRGLASAWAKDNIQVNAILPGWIDTDLTIQARKDVPGLHDRVLARTPASRWGVPEDLAGVAVFLASPASDFITGAAIPVDGGYSIQG
jgi:2-deoxy-D-gluconate 3-dehydrogenase